jgi:hypothetical protein
MTNVESARMTTNNHINNVITLLTSTITSVDPMRRAQNLADAQQQLGWAQRRAIDECQDQKLSWRQIGARLGVAHDALFRQHVAGGPVVTAAPFYRRDSRNVHFVTQLAVAFRTLDDDQVHVLSQPQVDGLESFTMRFSPANPSPYAERDLQYYYRPAPDLAIADLGRSAGYTLRPEGFTVAVCITEQVMDELFGPPFLGTPERQRWEAKLPEHQRTI